MHEPLGPLEGLNGRRCKESEECGRASAGAIVVALIEAEYTAAKLREIRVPGTRPEQRRAAAPVASRSPVRYIGAVSVV